MKIKFDSRTLTRALRDYAAASKKSQAAALEHTGKKLSVMLVREFKKGTPSKQKIYDDAQRIFAAGGRLATVKSRALAIAKHRVVNRTGGINVPASLMAQEIHFRQRHRGIVAASWIFRQWKPGSEPRTKQYRAGRLPSYALIVTDRPAPYVLLKNSTPGVTAQDGRHGYIDKALSAAVADLYVYVLRKERDALKKLNRR